MSRRNSLKMEIAIANTVEALVTVGVRSVARLVKGKPKPRQKSVPKINTRGKF